MKEEITPRQAGIFCFLMMLCSKILVLPSLVYQDANSSAIFVIIILFILEIFFLYIILKLKEKYKNLSFFDILQRFLGKFIAKLIYFLIFLYFLFLLLFVIREKFLYLKEQIFEEASSILFFLILFPTVASLVYHGLTALARTTEFYFVFVVFGFIVCLGLGLSSVSEFNTQIFTGINSSLIFNASSKYLFWFGDFLFIPLILNKVKLENGFGKVIFKYVIWGFILMIIFYFAYYTIYPRTAFMHYNAISDLVQYLSKLGKVERLNLVAILVVMFSLFFHSAIIMYSLNECVSAISPKTNRAQNLIFINLLVPLLSFLVFYSSDLIINFISIYGKFLAIFLLIILPLFLIILLIFDKNNKKYQKKVKK